MKIPYVCFWIELRVISDEIRVMCLAVPAKIVELEKDNAVVDAMGSRFKAKTTLLPDARLGDVVLIHAGFAISFVDEQEAKETWQLFAEMERLRQTPDES